jgi:two-component system sensor histidine kinase AlgZ
MLLAEGLKLLASCVLAPDLAVVYAQFVGQGALFEPVLLGNLLVLSVIEPWLKRVSYRQGVTIVLTLGVVIAVMGQLTLRVVFSGLAGGNPLSSGILALGVGGAILFYFNWRDLRLSPSLAESRLIALQARMRPHFLFNSLNSVLGLIREDPKRAETMLENLADLLRALMSEPRVLVPFSQELALARAYVEIETIRLGVRLQVAWHCDTAPADALVPPLMLQPLVENAVLHGVVPLEAGAQISVEAYEDSGNLILLVRNPSVGAASDHAGNHLALANIRERLELHFDVEARLRTYAENGEFVVQVRLPIHREQSA